VTVEKKSDRWISITQSVLLHGAVIGALAYGVYAYKTKPPPPQPTLAIEGSVVESKDVKNTPPPQAEEPPKPPEPEPAPPPEEQGPPTPSPEEVEQQKREAEEAIRKADEDRQAQERKVAEQNAREEAERKKREQEAEAKKVAEAKKRAEDKRKAEEAKQAAEREAELRKSLEAEERVTALRSSGAQIQWQQQIANRIKSNWNHPPPPKPGLKCVLHLTQVPGGAVTNVKVGECDFNAALRQTIENAVYASSPLPPPPDPALFDRDLVLTFTPD
jgi:colicin import membrane protein